MNLIDDKGLLTVENNNNIDISSVIKLKKVKVNKIRNNANSVNVGEDCVHVNNGDMSIVVIKKIIEKIEMNEIYETFKIIAHDKRNMVDYECILFYFGLFGKVCYEMKDIKIHEMMKEKWISNHS